MFLFTNVGLGVISSPISISSKGSTDEKPYPNFSTSSKSSMNDIVAYDAATTRHSFALIEKLHYRAEHRKPAAQTWVQIRPW
jgi:hypothetical protein